MARMRALDRKLLRDLWQMRGQASPSRAGDRLRRRHVRRCRCARFASLERHAGALLRALPLRRRLRPAQAGAAAAWPTGIAEIPGVAGGRDARRRRRDARRAGPGRAGRRPAVSIPVPARPGLNDLYLRSGRLPRAGPRRRGAGQRGLRRAPTASGPGDTVAAVINGRRQRLRIVGVALSPEYVYQIRPGEHPPRRPPLRRPLDGPSASWPPPSTWRAPSTTSPCRSRPARRSHGGHPPARPPARALRRPRRIPRRAARSRTGSIADELEQLRGIGIVCPSDLPRRRGVPAQRRPDPARLGAARADRGAQGVRLHATREVGLALPQAGPGRSALLGSVIGARRRRLAGRRR